MTSHSSFAGLGNLAIAMRPSVEHVRLGRAPPSELPPRSSVQLLVAASSRSTCSAALSSSGDRAGAGCRVLLARGRRRSRVAEAQRALTQVVADAEQVVDLAEAPLGSRRRAGRAARSARRISRRPQRSGAQSENAPKIARPAGVCCWPAPAGAGIELVGVGRARYSSFVGECRGFSFSTPMRPQPPGGQRPRRRATTTSTSRSAITRPVSFGPHALRQLLVGAQAADVGLVRVERPRGTRRGCRARAGRAGVLELTPPSPRSRRPTSRDRPRRGRRAAPASDRAACATRPGLRPPAAASGGRGTAMASTRYVSLQPQW